MALGSGKLFREECWLSKAPGPNEVSNTWVRWGRALLSEGTACAKALRQETELHWRRSDPC